VKFQPHSSGDYIRYSACSFHHTASADKPIYIRVNHPPLIVRKRGIELEMFVGQSAIKAVRRRDVHVSVRAGPES
jgi:hypothetical protein